MDALGTSATDADPGPAPREPLSLETLPRELLNNCLSRLTPLEVVAVRLLSSSWRDFVDEEAESIYRLIAIHQGWTREHTVGAGTGCVPGVRFDPRPDIVGADELQRAIAAQRTVDRPFARADTWAGFVAIRWRCEWAWTVGRTTQRVLKLAPAGLCVRFKLDPEAGGIVYNDARGACITLIDVATSQVFSSLPAPRYIHIEVSDGYLVWATTRESLEIARQDNTAPCGQMGALEGAGDCDRGRVYRLLRHASIGHDIRAYKARAPVVLVAGQLGDYSVVSLETGRIEQQGTIFREADDLEEANYVELDADRLYIAAGRRIVVVSRADDEILFTVTLNSAPSTQFIACHVDLRGRFLVALANAPGRGFLLLRDLWTESQLVLHIDEQMTALSVEVPLTLGYHLGSDELKRCAERPRGLLHHDEQHKGSTERIRFRAASDRLRRRSAKPRPADAMHRCRLCLRQRGGAGLASRSGLG